MRNLGWWVHIWQQLAGVMDVDITHGWRHASYRCWQNGVHRLEITNVEQMEWPDGCLGLPEGDEACVEAITPGWLLTFNIDNQEYKYRVDQTGTVIRQEP
jgi:hypothetical protein